MFVCLVLFCLKFLETKDACFVVAVVLHLANFPRSVPGFGDSLLKSERHTTMLHHAKKEEAWHRPYRRSSTWFPSMRTNRYRQSTISVVVDGLYNQFPLWIVWFCAVNTVWCNFYICILYFNYIFQSFDCISVCFPT